MSIEQRLGEIAELVEHRLDTLLSTDHNSDVPPRLLGAIRHGAMGQGKRFRPFLVIESARMLGVEPAQAVDTAAALELVHCYSLVHDDLPAMDNDTLRRGAPTVWAAYDEWTAILAGDALLTMAFEILAAPSTHPDGQVRAELVGALARASGPAGMVGGQALDLAAEKLRCPVEPSLDQIRRLQAMKTGALIRFGCEAGAILGRADADQRRALREYGTELGLAFQIADDILDVEGDAATLGKAVAKDAVLGKATLVSLMGIEASRRKLDETVNAAIAALLGFSDKAEMLRQAAVFAAGRKK